LYAVASRVHALISRPGSNMTSTINVLGDKLAVASPDAETGFCHCCNVNTTQSFTVADSLSTLRYWTPAYN